MLVRGHPRDPPTPNGLNTWFAILSTGVGDDDNDDDAAAADYEGGDDDWLSWW